MLDDRVQVAGWKSSIGLPDGSSSKICRPPGPLMTSLRKLTPFPRSRSTSALMSSTTKLDSVPAPRFGLASVGHRPPGRALGTRQQQPQIALRHLGEGRRCIVSSFEREVVGIEVDRLVDVVDHVPDAHLSIPHALVTSVDLVDRGHVQPTLIRVPPQVCLETGTPGRSASRDGSANGRRLASCRGACALRAAKRAGEAERRATAARERALVRLASTEDG